MPSPYPLPTDPAAGRLGKYELQSELGRGGMGIVYRGNDTVLQRPVAIKVLAPALSADPRFVQRFHQEAVDAANLEHPNIVTIFDVGQAGDVHFIVMELLAGMSLSQWVRQRGPLSLKQASAIIRQVASALDYAHGRGMVHCDVKPANIMVGKSGHATLMDFGLVRARQSTGQSGELGAGTLEYMAPEQVLGRPVDSRTDVYACGATLYHLLTGQAPFERAAPAATAYAQVHEQPSSLRKLRPDLPKPVDAVVLKALAKPPAERYQSAGALAADFAVAITGKTPPGLKRTPTPDAMPAKASQVLPVPPGASGTPPPAPARPGRVPARAVLAIILALFVVAAGLAWALSRSTEVEPTPTAGVVERDTSTPTTRPPTKVPTSTPGQVVVATKGPATATAVRPTATLAATGGAAATPTPTRGAIAVATPTRVAPTRVTLPAPRLLGPDDGATVSGEALFQWEWDGALAAGQAFEVRLWKEGSADHLGAAQVVVQPEGGRWQQRIRLNAAPAVAQGGSGVYWWTVAVVSTEPYARIGDEAPPRQLNYTGGEPAPPASKGGAVPPSASGGDLALSFVLALGGLALVTWRKPRLCCSIRKSRRSSRRLRRIETFRGFRYAGAGLPHEQRRTSTRYSTRKSRWSSRRLRRIETFRGVSIRWRWVTSWPGKPPGQLLFSA